MKTPTLNGDPARIHCRWQLIYVDGEIQEDHTEYGQYHELHGELVHAPSEVHQRAVIVTSSRVFTEENLFLSTID